VANCQPLTSQRLEKAGASSRTPQSVSITIRGIGCRSSGQTTAKTLSIKARGHRKRVKANKGSPRTTSKLRGFGVLELPPAFGAGSFPKVRFESVDQVDVVYDYHRRLGPLIWECGDSSPLLDATTRRGELPTADKSAARKSGSELPHSTIRPHHHQRHTVSGERANDRADPIHQSQRASETSQGQQGEFQGHVKVTWIWSAGACSRFRGRKLAPGPGVCTFLQRVLVCPFFSTTPALTRHPSSSEAGSF
jgi:hypothetical protein